MWPCLPIMRSLPQQRNNGTCASYHNWIRIKVTGSAWIRIKGTGSAWIRINGVIQNTDPDPDAKPRQYFLSKGQFKLTQKCPFSHIFIFFSLAILHTVKSGNFVTFFAPEHFRDISARSFSQLHMQIFSERRLHNLSQWRFLRMPQQRVHSLSRWHMRMFLQ